MSDAPLRTDLLHPACALVGSHRETDGAVLEHGWLAAESRTASRVGVRELALVGYLHAEADET